MTITELAFNFLQSTPLKMNRIMCAVILTITTLGSCSNRITGPMQTWENSDSYYYSEVKSDQNKQEAIKQLLLKIIELSEGKDEWNAIVLDKWTVNLGRVIGNIQNTDEAIGLDRGYKVAIHMDTYRNSHVNQLSDYQNELLEVKNEREIDALIMEVLSDRKFIKRLKQMSGKASLFIEISAYGVRSGAKFKVS